MKIVRDFEVFSISTLGDVVRIPPDLFGTSLKKAAINILKSKYESMVNSNLGYIIMILDAKVDPMGKVIAGNGGTFHRVTFDALTFSLTHFIVTGSVALDELVENAVTIAVAIDLK